MLYFRNPDASCNPSLMVDTPLTQSPPSLPSPPSPKKNFTPKNFTQIVRLSFVDLRWAHLYVSLVPFYLLSIFIFIFLSWCHVYNVHVLCIWLKVKCQGCVAESKRCCGSNIVELQVLNLHQTYIGLISKYLLNPHQTFIFSQYSHFFTVLFLSSWNIIQVWTITDV